MPGDGDDPSQQHSADLDEGMNTHCLCIICIFIYCLTGACFSQSKIPKL